MNTGRVDNPFQAPAARVADARVVSPGALRLEPKRVSAGDAIGWLSHGWEMFKEAPGAWIATFVVFAVIVGVVSFLPIINLITGLLYPVFMGGIMLGCRALQRGTGLRVGHLFEGFREQAGGLFLVGVINLVLAIGIVAIVGVVAAGVVGTAVAFAPSGSSGELGAMTGGTVMAMLIAVLIVMLLSVPVTMASWFAPALVAFHGVGALEAMKLSFVGCLRNTIPFLAYGVVMFLVVLVGVLPLGLGLLVVVPIVWASMFVGYEDIFVA